MVARGRWIAALMVSGGMDDLASMLPPRLKARVRVAEDGEWSESEGRFEDLRDMSATAEAAMDLGNKMLREYYFLPGPEGVPAGVSLQEQSLGLSSKRSDVMTSISQKQRPPRWIDEPSIPFSIEAYQINHQSHESVAGATESSCVSGFPYEVEETAGNVSWKPCKRFFLQAGVDMLGSGYDVRTTTRTMFSQQRPEVVQG
jgi:hypothetical protein